MTLFLYNGFEKRKKMSLKYLYGAIIIIFLSIVFIVPLSKSDSKSKETVNKIVEKTKEIMYNEKDIENEQQVDKSKIKTFNEVFVEPFKKDTLKKVQIEQSLSDSDKKANEVFIRLDKILEEKNIKLKKIEQSEEKMKEIDKKIEEIKKDYQKL